MLIGTFDGIYAYAPLKDQIRKVSSYDEPGRGLGHFPFMLFAVIIPVRCGLVLLPVVSLG